MPWKSTVPVFLGHPVYACYIKKNKNKGGGEPLKLFFKMQQKEPWSKLLFLKS